MAGNQEDFLSDRDLVALAKEWLGSLVGAGQPEVDPATGLPPVSIPPPQYSIDPRFQTQIGADPGPRFIGGPGILEHAATGPVAGVQGLRSLLKLLLSPGKFKAPRGTQGFQYRTDRAAERIRARDFDRGGGGIHYKRTAADVKQEQQLRKAQERIDRNKYAGNRRVGLRQQLQGEDQYRDFLKWTAKNNPNASWFLDYVERFGRNWR